MIKTAISITSALMLFIFSVSASYAASEHASLDELKARFSQGDYHFVIETLGDDASNTPSEYTLLISALMEEDLDEAEEVAEEFIAQHSENYRAYHMHASVMGAQASNSIFSALGYAKKAKDSLEKAATISPDNVEVYLALIQFHLAAPSIAGGDKEEAKRLVEQVAMMDAIEGQFAKAHLLTSEGEEEQAFRIYNDLQNKSESRVRAIFNLGSFYLYKEQYAKAFATLQALMDINLSPVERSSSPEWEAYERDMFNLLYGKYRIGLAAVKSDSNTTAGIEALQQYLHALQKTNIETVELPNSAWAKLRLAELLMRNNQIFEAETVLASLRHNSDERFNEILTKLKKKIARRT